MDYNSRPWTYEVVGIREDGSRFTFETECEQTAKNVYERERNTSTPTVLLTQSRKGVVKGQYEL